METKDKNSSGFSMIEVLITIVIMAFGLLGVASMQITGMRNNQSAYYRMQATNLANEFSDILRANKNQVTANAFGTAADDGNEFTTAQVFSPSISSCSNTTGCTANTMANAALKYWQEKVQQNLPYGIATTNRVANVYTVTIAWLDDRNKTVADDAGTGVDINGDGDDIDPVDFDADGAADSNEVNYQSFSTSFIP